MDGLSFNNVTLFLGKAPGRKQECFYFSKGTSIYPVAYIRKELLDEAQRLWDEMTGKPKTYVELGR